jgi:hypothetical protein
MFYERIHDINRCEGGARHSIPHVAHVPELGTDADVEERSMGSGTCSHGGASDSALRSNPRSKIAITRSLSKGLPGGSLRIP